MQGQGDLNLGTINNLHRAGLHGHLPGPGPHVRKRIHDPGDGVVQPVQAFDQQPHPQRPEVAGGQQQGMHVGRPCDCNELRHQRPLRTVTAGNMITGFRIRNSSIVENMDVES
eukprot:SM000055S18219  [mRNA]  locus=s55:1542:1983:- [translate_table: standard]